MSTPISVHHILFTRKLSYDLTFNLTSMDQHEIMSDQCSDGHLLRYREHAGVLTTLSQQTESSL